MEAGRLYMMGRLAQRYDAKHQSHLVPNQPKLLNRCGDDDL